MTVGAGVWYDTGAANVLKHAQAQWDDPTADSFAWVLLTDAYVPSDAHDTYSDISANEVTDADYAAKEVTGRVINTVGANNWLDSADAIFGPNVTIEAKYLVCVQGDKDSLVAGDELVFYIDLRTEGGTVSSTNSDFTVQGPANGWARFFQP